jgi:hypothetical protein
MKIKVRYIIQAGEETVECDSLEQAERRIKSMYSCEIEAYLIKKEFKGDELIGETLIG